MLRIRLRNSDIALLGRLNHGPLELGKIPADTVERLAALGLARKVLGSFKITRAGQLSFHRQSFTNASRRKVAQVSSRNPLFLQEARLGVSFDQGRLHEYLKARRALDSNLRRATQLPRWLMRLASETAGRFRATHEMSADSDGDAHSIEEHEPRKGYR